MIETIKFEDNESIQAQFIGNVHSYKLFIANSTLYKTDANNMVFDALDLVPFLDSNPGEDPSLDNINMIIAAQNAEKGELQIAKVLHMRDVNEPIHPTTPRYPVGNVPARSLAEAVLNSQNEYDENGDWSGDQQRSSIPGDAIVFSGRVHMILQHGFMDVGPERIGD